MMRFGLLTCGLTALLGGVILTLLAANTVFAAPVPATCDCEQPSQATEPCDKDKALMFCETYSGTEIACVGDVAQLAYKVNDFPRKCLNTTALTFCSSKTADCFIAQKCKWDATMSPKCTNNGDLPGAVWQPKLKNIQGACADGTVCAASSQ